MTAYTRIKFDSISFLASDIKVTFLQHTQKGNTGKSFTEKKVYSESNDTQLTIKGVITGLSKAFGETDQTAIARDRTALIALDDGYYHSFDSGKYVFSGVIIKGSLVFDDDAGNLVDSGNPNKFSITIKEW